MRETLMKKTRFVMMVRLLKRRQRRGEGEGLCNIILERQEQEGDGPEGEEKEEEGHEEENHKKENKKENNKKEKNKRGGSDGGGGRLSGYPQHMPNLFQSKMEKGTGPT